MQARSPAARPGRKRQATALHELHGGSATSHGRAPDVETVEGVGDVWAPPPWFDDEQREQWAYGVEHAPLGLLTGSDRDALAAWAVAAVELRRAHLILRQSGALIHIGGNKSKRVMLNPIYRVISAQTSIMLRTGAELGFSPAARAMLGRRGTDADAPTGPRQLHGSSRLAAYLEAKPDNLDS